MLLQDVLPWLRRRPFRPFRLRLADGGAYEVRHPDQVRSTQTALTILVLGGDPEAEEAYDTVDLFHVTRIQPMPPPPPPPPSASGA